VTAHRKVATMCLHSSAADAIPERRQKLIAQ
jgi:hypothetical protein